MAMNGDLMATQILAALAALTPVQQSNPADVWKAVCTAIVTHITTQGTVATNLSTLFLSGVPVPMDGGAALQTAWSIQPPQIGVIT